MTVFVPGNQVRLLENGSDYFPALVDAIDQARREIHLETYLFADDDTGRRVVAALGRAAARGVAVRVLVDVAGYFSTSGAPFHPVSPVRAYDSRTDPLGPVAAAGQRTLAAATVQGNPSAESVPDGATGVAYNLTVTQSRGIGHFRLFPGFPDARLPGASVLNWPGDGYTRANAGFVGVAADRSVTLYNGGGDSHALLDVVGYFK